MRPWFGLHMPNYTFPDTPPERILDRVVDLACAAEQAGFGLVTVMDHFYQIPGIGPVSDPMLEGYTTLGFIAANTTRARLGLMVGGVHYRNPGLWIKATTTLDVLSGGRAWLGIGAAWNQEESNALGFPFPPLGERFEMLEETLQMAHQAWTGERGSEGAFDGRHFHARRLLNSPQSISRPRPPIMVGGGGERKTLRLVAQYADACNVFGGPPAIHRKYEILRAHCETVGRDPDEIERSTLQGADPGREPAAHIVNRFGELGDAGAQHVIFTVPDVNDLGKLEAFGRDVLPQLRDL